MGSWSCMSTSRGYTGNTVARGGHTLKAPEVDRLAAPYTVAIRSLFHTGQRRLKDEGGEGEHEEAPEGDPGTHHERCKRPGCNGVHPLREVGR